MAMQHENQVHVMYAGKYNIFERIKQSPIQQFESRIKISMKQNNQIKQAMLTNTLEIATDGSMKNTTMAYGMTFYNYQTGEEVTYGGKFPTILYPSSSLFPELYAILVVLVIINKIERNTDEIKSSSIYLYCDNKEAIKRCESNGPIHHFAKSYDISFQIKKLTRVMKSNIEWRWVKAHKTTCQ